MDEKRLEYLSETPDMSTDEIQNVIQKNTEKQLEDVEMAVDNLISFIRRKLERKAGRRD